MIKKIETKEDKARKKKRNSWIIGGILIFIMLGSTFGIIVDSFGTKNTLEKIEYNGYEFVNQNDLWFTIIGEYQFAFKYNPTQIERISSEIDYLNSYSGLPVYVFSENDIAAIEIYRNLGEIVQRFQGACLEEENCPENWPIKDCTNKFIIIREANKSRIYQNESCVFIEGNSENLTQITDEFLFKILNIEE